MSTLTDLRKDRGLTVKAIAEQLGLSQGRVSDWLHARNRFLADTRPEVLTILGVSQEEYQAAWDATEEEETCKWKASHPPTMTHEQWQASIKDVADRTYARMSPEQRQQLPKETEHRSPLDILIDRAVGRE